MAKIWRIDFEGGSAWLIAAPTAQDARRWAVKRYEDPVIDVREATEADQLWFEATGGVVTEVE